MSQRLIHQQLVQDRFFQSFRTGFFRTYDIEYKDFVLAFLQPATRHVKSLLRTDFPNTADAISVYINQSLAPSLEVQERIARLFYLERCPVTARYTLALRIFYRLQRFKLQAFIPFIPVFQVINLPAFQFGGTSAVLQCHASRNTFEVLDSPSEVDTSHGFHQDIQLCAFLTSRNIQLLFSIPAVQLADVFPVDKDLSVIVSLVHGQCSRSVYLRQNGPVEDTSESLVVFFHGAEGIITLWFGQVGE